MAIAAILSQVQDGKEQPFVYASKQLNTADLAYKDSKFKMLALV
jgi:hypothetical protein